MLSNILKKKFIASDDTFINRMEMCLNCTHFRAYSRRCIKCGCFMMVKSRLQPAKCPEGRWDA